MSKSAAKKWFGIIHLWIGLLTGIIVFLVSITGCIYVFRDEIFHAVHRNLETNTTANTGTPLPCTTLKKIAQKQLGEAYPIEDINVFTDKQRNWEFKTHKHNEEAVSYFDWIVYDWIVYVNPYTGEVAGVLDHKHEFFELVKMFHWSLLMHTDYGQPIVGVSVLLFVLSLITGLILWWPKNTKLFKERIKVKWNAKWRRVNYDLHRTLGFYTIPVALIISITGLVWAFKWMTNAVYIIASLSVTPPAEVNIRSICDTPTFSAQETILNRTVTDALEKNKQAYSLNFWWGEPGDTTAALEAYIRPDGMVYYNSTLEKYDKYSGKLLYTRTFNDLNPGEKMIYMNYDIHVGAALGTGGKIIAFCASLVCASFPVTGFMIWWGRRKKKQIKTSVTKQELELTY